MSSRILLTGVTGGLGAKILHDLLKVESVPPAEIIATARSETSRASLEAQGVQFRVADYDKPDTLASAFRDVDNLLFMSSSASNDEARMRQHGNVIEAAKKAGVGMLWYVSLAFGGFEDSSAVFFQKAHYDTENLLRDSGLDFINLRAGVYADAFPLFINWYPSSTSVPFPKITPAVTESRIAFTARDELGEGIAALLARGLSAFPSVQPRTDKKIIILTGPKAESLVDLLDGINRARGGKISAEYLEPQQWIEECAKNDVGGKPRGWFELRLGLDKDFVKGDAALVDPALETILGRRPESGTESVERLVKENPEYTWHQNHAR